MKYILSENKMFDLVERVLKSQFKKIYDVDFGTKKVALGSSSGEIIDRTVIKVTFVNPDMDFRGIYKEMSMVLNDFLNIDLEKYGSPYELQLFAIEKIRKI